MTEQGYEGVELLNYKLVRKLGEGGFGAVYLAEHVELGRRSAVKILHPEFARHREVVDRFFREAKAVCAIGHQVIVDVTNFGRLPSGEPFYMMDFVDGESLAAVIRKRRLPVEWLVDIFDPVTSALSAAHAKRIVHRDLKPDNIMVREEDGAVVEVKLLDFGIAKLMDSDDKGVSRTGSAMGTPSYMAPEQARDAKSVDARADVYGFAATVFAALSGRPPFDGASVTEIMIAAQTQPAPLLRTLVGVTPELEAVVARCLEKDPAKRPATVREAWSEMRTALGAGPLPAASTGHMRRATTPVTGVAAVAPTLLPTVAPTIPPSPHTTLGSAAAESTRPKKSSRSVWVALASVAVAATIVIVLVARSGGSSRTEDVTLASTPVATAPSNPQPRNPTETKPTPVETQPTPTEVTPVETKPPPAETKPAVVKETPKPVVTNPVVDPNVEAAKQKKLRDDAKRELERRERERRELERREAARRELERRELEATRLRRPCQDRCSGDERCENNKCVKPAPVVVVPLVVETPTPPRTECSKGSFERVYSPCTGGGNAKAAMGRLKVCKDEKRAPADHTDIQAALIRCL